MAIWRAQIRRLYHDYLYALSLDNQLSVLLDVYMKFIEFFMLYRATSADFFIWALVSISITNLLFPTQVLQSTFISLQPDVCSSWCIYEIYHMYCALSCYIGRFLVWALVQIPITNLLFPTWVLQSTPYIFTTRLLFLLFYTWNLPPIVLQRQFFCSTISRTSDHQLNSSFIYSSMHKLLS